MFKRIKKLEDEIKSLRLDLNELIRIINEQQQQLNPPVFGGRK